EEERETFRATSLRSREAKLRALNGDGEPAHEVNVPRFRPTDLMPLVKPNGLAALSIFSGGGGLDLGFDRAGFGHGPSYDTREAAGVTPSRNRPAWEVYGGADGDVRSVAWRTAYRGTADVIHGGPPCQPFSTAGRQRGHKDERNLLPDFASIV